MLHKKNFPEKNCLCYTIAKRCSCTASKHRSFYHFFTSVEAIETQIRLFIEKRKLQRKKWWSTTLLAKANWNTRAAYAGWNQPTKSQSYLPIPLMPAEPRLRHCSLKRSIGSWEPLEPSIFLHFCLICASDLAVAAMFQSLLCVTNMAPFASHEGFIIPLLWQRPHRIQSLHGKKKQWAQKLFKQKKTQTMHNKTKKILKKGKKAKAA